MGGIHYDDGVDPRLAYVIARPKGSHDFFRFVKYMQGDKGCRFGLPGDVFGVPTQEYAMTMERANEAQAHLARRNYEVHMIVKRDAQNHLDLDNIILIEETLPQVLQMLGATVLPKTRQE